MSESIREMVERTLAEIPPHIDAADFSPPEREQANLIWQLFHILTSLIGAFQTDIELFDYAAAHREIEMKWTPIACRDAAMTIWEFQVALKHIHAALKACKKLRTEQRELSLRAAIGRFGQAFPDATPNRIVAAHRVEHAGTAKSQRENRLKGTPVLIQMCWAGRTVQSTREGRMVSFEISNASVEVMKSVRAMVFNAFRSASQPINTP